MKLKLQHQYVNQVGQIVTIVLKDFRGWLGDDGNYYDEFGYPHTDGGYVLLQLSGLDGKVRDNDWE